MFGTVLVRFQQFVIDNYGQEEMYNIFQQLGLPKDTVFRTIKFYPDEQLDSMVEILAREVCLGQDSLYKKMGLDFGRYLIKTYKVMFFPSWRTLEVIEKAAPKVFRSIQFVDPNAPKSYVMCERLSKDEVILRYMSPRKMCPYILGIIDAMAEYFDEKVDVTHATCMRSGASECELHVKLIKAAKPALTG